MQHQVSPFGKAIITDMDILAVKHAHGDLMLSLLAELGAPVVCTSVTGNTWQRLDGYTWYWTTEMDHGHVLYLFAWTQGDVIDDRLNKIPAKQIEYKREPQ